MGAQVSHVSSCKGVERLGGKRDRVWSTICSETAPCSCRIPGYRNKAYMGKAVVQAEADAVADLFRTSDAQVIRKYNPVYASGYDVGELSPDEKVPSVASSLLFLT